MNNRRFFFDPDSNWLSKVKEFYIAKGLLSPVCDTSIENNLVSLQLKKIDLLVINLECNQSLSFDLIKKSKEKNQSIILAVIENESSLKARQNLIDIGITNFIKKELSIEEIFNQLELADNPTGNLNKTEKTEIQTNKPIDVTAGNNLLNFIKESYCETSEFENFSPLSSLHFKINKSLPFAIYLNRGEAGPQLVLPAKEKIPPALIQEILQVSNPKKAYIEVAAIPNYTSFCFKIVEKLSTIKKKDPILYLLLFSALIKKYQEETYLGLDSKEFLDKGKAIFNQLYLYFEESAANKTTTLKIINDFFIPETSLEFLTTILSLIIASEFNWYSAEMASTVGFACVYMNIGNLEIPKELWNRNPICMEKEEFEKFKDHPLYGENRLKKIRFLNRLVSQIVSQHHEAYDGSGFPKSLSGDRINMQSHIVSFACSLSQIIYEKEMAITDVVQLLLMDPLFMDKVHPKVFEKFQEIIAPLLSRKKLLKTA